MGGFFTPLLIVTTNKTAIKNGRIIRNIILPY
jgi:hypothetical protein